jgi:putative flippase GtrA
MPAIKPIMSVLQPVGTLFRRLQAACRDRAIMLKALSFALVGLVNFAVDFGLFSFSYFYLALPIIAANVIAWIVAVSGSYVLNSMITFAAESGRQLRIKDYATFVISQTGGLVANTATVFVASYFMPVLMAKAIAIVASFAVNFSLSHLVVFRPRQPEGDAG